MGKHIFAQAMSSSLSQFNRGQRTFRLFGVEFRILLAHDDQYQVVIPDGSEIFRIIDHGAGNVAIMAV